MVFSKFIALAFLLLSSFVSLDAQNGNIFNIYNQLPNYRGCNNSYSIPAEIMYNGYAIADRFCNNNKCALSGAMDGILSVSIIDRGEKSAHPNSGIKFNVAIKNLKTNTMYLLTKEAVVEINLKDIFSHCKGGDVIMLLTDDKRYKLSQHELEILWGC